MKNKNIIILVTILIVAIVVGSLVWLKFFKKEELSLNDNLVKELYDEIETYFIPELYEGFESYNENNFYMDKLVTYDTLSDEAKLYYAYQTIKDIKDKKINSCDELKSYTFNNMNLYEYCLKDPYMLSNVEFMFNDVNKAKLEDAYHKMYGYDKEMPLKSFTMSFTGVCLYSDVEDEYLCHNQVGGDTTFGISRTKLISADKYFDRIELYDRYVWVDLADNNGFDYYKSRFNKELIANVSEYNEDNDAEYLDKGALYKHVFKKDSDGNYYWYSSERVE